MAATASYSGVNSGIQVAQNYAPITANFVQLETTLNQACLRDLRTTDPGDDKKRITKTNGGLLKDSYCWILDNEEFKQWQHNQTNRVLWIRGDPGKGKTMLLCGIIDELTRLHGSAANISFFFCQATDVRINNATSVLRGLIYSLVEKSPALLPHMRARYDKAGKALFKDINTWSALSTIFTSILKDPSLENAYLIIDALDECIYGLRSLLDLVL
ncbi:NACHT nucleoside triphosphatase [Penicillium freii]|nr:NACHT nucleoside triphosphatase [Penicillium freii]